MVPFKPHAMLQFRLAGHFDEIAVQQLTKFGPAPKLQSPVVTWHQVDPTGHHCQVVGSCH